LSNASALKGAGKLQRRTRRVIRPVAKRLWHFDLEGFDQLPTDGPAILCPNHISFLDSAFLMLNVQRNISFVGKAEYMDSWKTKFVFPAMGMIPIDRSGGSKSTAALDAAEAVLRRGELFGIFPEGTRSRDGLLYKGHTGAVRLALKVGCPIFPVGVIGTREIQPPDAKLPKIRLDCTIKIGKALRGTATRPTIIWRCAKSPTN
jgi:1-acyl-sn-glycerol-3-phosphate acyltransferase